MVLHNPNNWHWVNKDASAWTRQWFEDNLTKLEAKEGDVSVKINKVISMTGDVDVAQRKGKVITIYDVRLTLEYTGMSFCRIPALSFFLDCTASGRWIPVTTSLQERRELKRSPCRLPSRRRRGLGNDYGARSLARAHRGRVCRMFAFPPQLVSRRVSDGVRP